MNAEFDSELRQDFLIEAGELIERLGEQLVGLETAPDDSELLNAVFRAFHTVKGGAGFMAIEPMVLLCHHAEDLLNEARNGTVVLGAAHMDALLEALDLLHGMMAALGADMPLAIPPAALLQRLLPAVAGARASIGHSHVLGPELRTHAGARAVLHKLLAKAALRLRHHGLLAGALSVRVRFLGVDARWEADLAFDPCDDTRSLLRLLTRLTDGAGRGRLPGPVRAKPLAVAVTLHRLVERARTTPSLFGEAPRVRALDAALDRINARFGPNAVHFGGMQRALDHAAAPMRIPFSRIPDAAAEDESGAHALWQQAYDRARVLAEAAHRRAEQDRSPRDAKLEAPRDPRRRP